MNDNQLNDANDKVKQTVAQIPHKLPNEMTVYRDVLKMQHDRNYLTLYSIQGETMRLVLFQQFWMCHKKFQSTLS